MRRRDFLTAVALGHFTPTRRLLTSQPTLERAAVVIGVDKSGKLPVLKAAASGAARVTQWLSSQGFEVVPLVTPPVRRKDIFDAVASLVNRGTFDQLVIYFSGHGFLNHFHEMWLLSDAPDDANEAVSLLESIELARWSGIKNVVFISDCCRSVPVSLKADRVTGGFIFPNTGNSNVDVSVDRFFAAKPGESAYEVPVDVSSQQFGGIFTESLLDAFRQPKGKWVKQHNVALTLSSIAT